MPKFAANLTMLFNEHPFLDRFEAAAQAGFEAVEFLFPYAFQTAEIQARLRGNGLKLVLHNLPAGDWDAGERGIACLPDRVDSSRIRAENASAVPGAGRYPSVHIRAAMAGLFNAAFRLALSRRTTSAGVPAGATSPCQPETT